MAYQIHEELEKWSAIYFTLCPSSPPPTLSPLSGDCRTMKLIEAIQNALEITLEKDPTASM